MFCHFRKLENFKIFIGYHIKSYNESSYYSNLVQYLKGVGAETTDFGPISDFVMLLFNICAMILVSKNPNFMKIC